jgi:hypothetical protein
MPCAACSGSYTVAAGDWLYGRRCRAGLANVRIDSLPALKGTLNLNGTAVTVTSWSARLTLRQGVWCTPALNGNGLNYTAPSRSACKTRPAALMRRPTA